MRRLIGLILLNVLVFGASGQEIVNGDLGKELDRLVQSRSLGQFWGSVLVAKDGEIILAKGYGAANAALEPMVADSLFDIGSITKCFTAAAILNLEEEGKLALDDSITRFFPDVPADKKVVTLRHLLSHSSGLDQRAGRDAFSSGDERDPVINGLLRDARDAEPGERFQYSNVGYFILAGVIEKASGTTWERYVTDSILRPAGMKASGCCGDSTLDPTLVTARMDGKWSISGDASTWPYGVTWGYRGAGGVVSSATDMYAWDRALRTDAVLGAPARAAMFTPVIGSYALGWDVKGSPNGRVASHAGAVRGYRCSMTRWLDADACVIVLTNEFHEPVGLSKALTERLFPALAETTSMHAAVSRYPKGEYGMVVLPDTVTIAARAGKQEGSAEILITDPAHEKPALVVTLSPGAAAALLPKLEDAIAGITAARADMAKVGLKVEIYTASYRLKSDEDLSRDGEGVGLEAMAGLMHPEPGADHKVLLYIKDESRQMLPVFIKLEAGTAAALAKELKAAVGR